ncbi:hypothetical protein HU200_056985 [Digitaria exilis]|uniref:Uncharacterized protein n=1 Tax=Digitaria exilis TaxID=1010633 RepID=A0A835E5E8_9POAL|nr:hypothetical protein HU200_056985 [Digitaria exilis]
MAKIMPKALLPQSKVMKGPSQIGVTTIFAYLILSIIVVSSVYAAFKYWVGKGPAEGTKVLTQLCNRFCCCIIQLDNFSGCRPMNTCILHRL